MIPGLVVDLFAGGGGASAGIEAALGRPVDVAINHDPVAIAVHRANHPSTHHHEADIWKVRPRVATEGRPVDLLWASPDCRSYSRAKGGQPRSESVRLLPWTVIRWASDVRPRVICLENVPEFEEWCPLLDGMPDRSRLGLTFRQWVGRLRGLGYVVEWRVLDASHYGAPTRRRRLFLIARLDGLPIRWPEPTHGRGRLPVRTAAECIDWDRPCPSIFGRSKPLAEKTLWRIAQGIRRFVLESPRPFVVKLRGTNTAADIAAPLPTVTAGGTHLGLIAPSLVQIGYGERAGQAPRALNILAPLGTVVAGGPKHALVAAFLARHFGGVVGASLEEPLHTITARDHHSQVQAQLFPAGADQPFRTAEVRAFLTAYYSSGSQAGQSLLEPLRTVTVRHRLGLVTVAGEDFQIVDIGLRMLTPRELLRAQFGRFAEGYDLSPAKTQADQVRMVGNSAPPEVVEAIVRANVPERGERAA